MTFFKWLNPEAAVKARCEAIKVGDRPIESGSEFIPRSLLRGKRANGDITIP